MVHGGLLQQARERAIHQFQYHERSILISTFGVGGIGLNFTDVHSIVFMDFPTDTSGQALLKAFKLYLGRVGRLGNEGRALIFFDPPSGLPFALNEFLIDNGHEFLDLGVGEDHPRPVSYRSSVFEPATFLSDHQPPGEDVETPQDAEDPQGTGVWQDAGQNDLFAGENLISGTNVDSQAATLEPDYDCREPDNIW